MTTQPKSPRTLRQRITFVVRALLIAVVALIGLIPLLLGYLFMLPLTAPGCGGETIPPFAYEEVSFLSSEFDRSTSAYFIPADQPTNARQSAATVIVLPTGGMGRGDRMDEIAVYHAGGFAVLTYTSRICVGAAANTLGYREAQQVGDALAYLGRRADIDMDRIGVHGFSAGGAAAIMAAAQFPELRAVVAEGGYHDFAAEIDQSALPVSWLEPIFHIGRAGELPDQHRAGLERPQPRQRDRGHRAAPDPADLRHSGTRLGGCALAASASWLECGIMGSSRRATWGLSSGRAG